MTLTYRKTSRKRKARPELALNVRISPDLSQRIDRLLRFMEPRILAMTGRKASRSEVIRAMLLRGIEYTEREFGMSDPVEGYILVDEEER